MEVDWLFITIRLASTRKRYVFSKCLQKMAILLQSHVIQQSYDFNTQITNHDFSWLEFRIALNVKCTVIANSFTHE